MHTALRLGLRAAETIRGINPSCHICFYGLYASLNERFLLEGFADSVVGGEFLWPLTAWIHALATGSTTQVAGVSTPRVSSVPYLDRPTAMTPSRAGLPPLDRYARLDLGGRQILAGAVEASHGCLHECLHCPLTPVYAGRFFIVPRDSVLQDIRALVAAGAGHITFADPDFFNGPRHSMEIVRQMHREFPDLTFDLTTKVENILRHRDRFSELKGLGCAFVVTAVESLSNRVLSNLEKGHGRDDVFEALAIVRGARIELRPSFVAFTPWTSIDDLIELFELVRLHDLADAVDPVQMTLRLLLPPGSALLKRSADSPWLGELDSAGLTYVWRHPDPRMDRLQNQFQCSVEQAAAARRDPIQTLHQLEALACSEAGRPHPSTPDLSSERRRTRGPRLTEDWFC